MSHRIKVRQTGYGRNDLCPCGSGKKYKKCCGLPKHREVQIKNETEVTEQVSVETTEKIQVPTQKALDWMMRTILRGY